MEESWDHLIVLDACRYDYFARTFPRCLTGELSTRTSPGTWTYEWAQATFPDRYDDVVYVSSNAFIRSTVSDLEASTAYQNGRFSRSKDTHVSDAHFHKVVDVWYNGWDAALGTVHPRTVNQAALYALNRYPAKRLIVHYMQPHYPYLSLGGQAGTYRWRDRALGFVRWRLHDLFGEATAKAIIDRLGLPSRVTGCQVTANKLGVDGLKRAYAADLHLVLEHVRDLVAHLDGTVVVTADHGELLGEHGHFSHTDYEEMRPEQLTTVPWLEIRQNRATQSVADRIEYQEAQPTKDEEARIVRDRLAALGYM